MNIINEFFVSFILIKLYFKFKVCRKIKFPLLWKFYFSKWKFYFSADIMRKNKLATKSDYDLLEKVKLSILKNDVNLDKSLKNTMEANTILTKLFNGKKESIFKIEKKINNINNYIEILKQSNAEVKEYENYLKILEKNKEFLKDYAKNRLDNLKLSISKNKNKIPLNAYIIQEYKKGCEYLNINDDLKLVSVKSNKINYGGFNKSKDNQKIL